MSESSSYQNTEEDSDSEIISDEGNEFGNVLLERENNLKEKNNLKSSNWNINDVSDKQKHKDDINRQFINVVKRKNGEILEGKYEKKISVATIKCSCGNEFNEKIIMIMSGVWCKKCSNGKQRKCDVKLFEEILQNREGTCDYDKETFNFNSRNKLKLNFKCHNSHEFQMNFRGLIEGYWCDLCYYNSKKIYQTAIEKIIEEKGGKVTFPNGYDNGKTRCNIICEKGHKWEARVSHITEGIYCIGCVRENRRLKIEDIRAYVESEGYKLLTTEYKSNAEKILIECKCRKNGQLLVCMH